MFCPVPQRDLWRSKRSKKYFTTAPALFPRGQNFPHLHFDLRKTAYDSTCSSSDRSPYNTMDIIHIISGRCHISSRILAGLFFLVAVHFGLSLPHIFVIALGVLLVHLPLIWNRNALVDFDATFRDILSWLRHHLYDGGAEERVHLHGPQLFHDGTHGGDVFAVNGDRVPTRRSRPLIQRVNR